MVVASIYFVRSRISTRRGPTIIGGIISLIGALGLRMFHSTEFEVSTNLAVMVCGLSLTVTATWNIVVSKSPKEFTGIYVGVGSLLFFIGMAVGPALSGIFMEDHETIQGVEGSYPSAGSCRLVFLTAGLLSVFSIGFALMLRNHQENIAVSPFNRYAQIRLRYSPSN